MDDEAHQKATGAAMAQARDWGSVAFRCLQYFGSTTMTVSAIVYIVCGIAGGYAVLEGHPAVHFVILAFVLVLLAYLEGLQVAILALESQDGEEWRVSHPRAFALHKLVNEGSNVQRFLVGRQFYVVFVVFLCSQVTTFPDFERPDAFPAILWLIFVETGLPGALLVLAFGQLMPQLIAARHPVVFCNILGASAVLWMTLCLEALGVTHFSWLLTAAVSRAAGLDRSDGASSHQESAAAPPAKVVARDVTGCGTVQHRVVERMAHIQDEWKRTDACVSEQLQSLLAPLDSDAESNPESNAPPMLVDAEMAEAGLRASGLDDPNALGGYHDTPKPGVYPTPQVIAAYLASIGQEVPCFLLPPCHELHVPPHIVAYSLMAGLVQQQAGSPLRQPRAVGSDAVSPSLKPLPPPLSVIPRCIDAGALELFRSNYQAFRLGDCNGAKGEIHSVAGPIAGVESTAAAQRS